MAKPKPEDKKKPEGPLTDSEEVFLEDEVTGGDDEVELAAAPAPKKAAARKPVKFLRGQQKFEHHLFELLPNKGKVNRSYDPNAPEPELHDFKHKHFFHSVNQRGIHQTKTEEKNRHFHHVSVDWDKADEDGNPVVTVGPAMRTIAKTIRGKKVRQEKPVSWKAIMGDDEVDIVDEHIHDAVYRGSEIIQERGQVKMSDEEAARVFGMSAPSKKIDGVKITE